MSTSSVQGAGSVQALAAMLTKRFDADSSGHLSSEEFTAMLSQLLTGVQPGTQGTAIRNGAVTTTPLATALTSLGGERARVGRMAGFDEGKLADTSRTSIKYQIGRVLQHYPNTPAGLREALPELQAIVPGLAIAGSKGDQLDFGSFVDARGTRIGVVDVIQAAGLGGVAWQWAPVE